MYQIAHVASTPNAPNFVLTPDGAPVILRWESLNVDALPAYIRVRITAANDSTDEKWVEAFWPNTGDALRAFDIRHARSYTVYEITIAQKDALRIAEEGLGLRLSQGTTPLEVICNPFGTPELVPPCFTPHMLDATDRTPLENFQDRLLDYGRLLNLSTSDGLAAQLVGTYAQSLNEPDFGSQTSCLAVAFYLCDLTRLLLEPTGDSPELRAKLAETIQWVIARQTVPGLWTTVIEDRQTPYDTAGSAGIAAAIAISYTKGLIGTRYPSEVQKAVSLLRQYLTPDGFLTGATVNDSADPALQTSGYTVIAPVGMGMFGMLLATSKVFRA